MKKTLIGLVASMAMAGMAFAGGDKWSKEKPHEQSSMQEDTTQDSATTDTSLGTEPEEGVGGSGMQGDKSGMATGQELSGKVVKADRSSVFVEHMGAVVPLKIDKNTKFQGDTLKAAKDLKEGQEIRASFSVENKTSNVAKSIELSSEMGQGGSGFESDVNQGLDIESDAPSIPEDSSAPSSPLPEEPGTQPSNPTY